VVTFYVPLVPAVAPFRTRFTTLLRYRYAVTFAGYHTCVLVGLRAPYACITLRLFYGALVAVVRYRFPIVAFTYTVYFVLPALRLVVRLITAFTLFTARCALPPRLLRCGCLPLPLFTIACRCLRLPFDYVCIQLIALLRLFALRIRFGLPTDAAFARSVTPPFTLLRLRFSVDCRRSCRYLPTRYAFYVPCRRLLCRYCWFTTTHAYHRAFYRVTLFPPLPFLRTPAHATTHVVALPVYRNVRAFWFCYCVPVLLLVVTPHVVRCVATAFVRCVTRVYLPSRCCVARFTFCVYTPVISITTFPLPLPVAVTRLNVVQRAVTLLHVCLVRYVAVLLLPLPFSVRLRSCSCCPLLRLLYRYGVDCFD